MTHILKHERGKKAVRFEQKNASTLRLSSSSSVYELRGEWETNSLRVSDIEIKMNLGIEVFLLKRLS